MIRRLIGLIILLVGILGVAVSVAGVRGVMQLVDSLEGNVGSTVGSSAENLNIVVETLTLTQDSLREANAGMETVETLVLDVSKTITDTKPLLNFVRTVATEDVPSSLEAVQSTIPNVANVAETIDDTLTTLNNFAIDEEFGFPAFLNIDPITIQYDLGIDYNPDQPFEDSITEIGTSLDGIPEQLRSMAPALETTEQNLTTLSIGIEDAAGNIEAINTSVAEFVPLLDEYAQLVTDAQSGIETAGESLESQLQLIEQGIIILFVWFGLTQLAPIYIGYELVRGRRMVDDDDFVQVDEIDEILEKPEEPNVPA